MENINTYIVKVLGQVCPFKTIELRALDFIDRVLSLCVYNVLISLMDNDTLCKAVLKVMSGELLDHTVSEMVKACHKYDRHREDTNIQRTYLAGLQFSVKMVEDYVKKLGVTNSSNYFLVAITALVEYLCAEILELSGKISESHVIVTSDVIKAIRNDEELKKTIVSNNFIKVNGRSIYEYVMDSRRMFSPFKPGRVIGVFGSIYSLDRNMFEEIPYNGTDYLEIESEDQTLMYEESMLDHKYSVSDVPEIVESDNLFLNGAPYTVSIFEEGWDAESSERSAEQSAEHSEGSDEHSEGSEDYDLQFLFRNPINGEVGYFFTQEQLDERDNRIILEYENRPIHDNTIDSHRSESDSVVINGKTYQVKNHKLEIYNEKFSISSILHLRLFVIDLKIERSPDLQDIHLSSKFRCLKSLSLNGSYFDTIDFIENLNCIDKLSLEECLYVKDFTPISSCHTLTELRISNNNISNLDFLKGLTSLTVLIADDCFIEDLNFMSELDLLEVISLDHNDIGNIHALANKEHLTDVSFNLTDIYSIEALRHASKLEKLSIGNTDVSDIDILSDKYNLKTLEIYGTYVKSLEPLRGLPSLKMLNFSKCRINDISPIVDCPKIENVDMVDTDVTQYYELIARKSVKLIVSPNGATGTFIR